eukprot:gene4467-6317_t
MSSYDKPTPKAGEWKQKREKGFSLSGLESVKLREYNALHDPNMKHYFENNHVQYLLYRTGQIDRNGRVIDMEKNKSKLFILEREFKEAEKIEERRQKEEMEMRYRVQKKRFNEIENARKQEILERLKAERDLSKEIVSTLRLAASGSINKDSSAIRNSTSSSSLR